MIAAAAAVTLPDIALDDGRYEVAAPAMRAVILGVAIVGAASLLSWTAEVVQPDVSQGRGRSAAPTSSCASRQVHPRARPARDGPVSSTRAGSCVPRRGWASRPP